ncbi:hypothetical protein D3C77_453480 [compost metagenome]
MKLHKDGTVEGTPQEIAEYNKLQEKKEPFKVIKPTGLNANEHKTVITSGRVDGRYPGEGTIYVGTTPSAAKFLDGLMSAIGNRGNLH